MWDNPDALNRLTRLILAATLLFTLWTAGRAVLEAWFPFRQITVLGAEHPETRQAARALGPRLKGGFFSMDLAGIHRDFERLPWVRHADVRRLWPGRLLVQLEEHRAAAAWNDRALLDVYGEVFDGAAWRGLPRFYAPEGMEREVARRYGEFARIVTPLGMRVDQLVVSARQSWRLRLSGGVSVELGRDKLNERMSRFARFYPRAVAAVGAISRVDMRYPNGFAGEVHRESGATVVAKRAKQA
jgi:cell division protein FtsQ